MTERLVLYGAGALASEIVDVLVRLRSAGADKELLGCLIDPTYEAPESFGGRPVFRDLGALSGDDSVRFVVALGDPGARARAVERLEAVGARFSSVIDPAVLIGASSSVAEGSVMLAHASVTAGSRLGRHVLVNPGCTIAHDNQIADFATLSPGVHLAGHVTVEAGAFLGTGACVIPGIRIGARAFVGAGSIVIRNVAPGHTVLGNPARVLRRG
ncbi:acetyltransferase [Methylobacterium sp. WL18]|uniref:acetyltransferase n=1 Tax=Methylobacterium sp. WL18 TaxID=2603897 RepID=UPI0011CAF4D3|nr:acetyltransferase [Methylobacterium sp. WL18]TXN75946.1 acetyltransferase [Methylobacterium sp. WL18]